MDGLRKFINGPGGNILAIVLVVLGVGGGAWYLYSASANNPANIANRRIFIDATTGKPFNVDLTDVAEVPVKAPSGGMTGYPAELCYWTADGKPKADPTPVLLNERMGKEGPTFCPDCKRRVVGHNPQAMEGAKPPPTEAEYRAGRP